MDGHLTDYLDVMSMTTVAANLQPCARTRTIALSWCFLCLSGCSPVLADQAVDDLPVRDPGGHTCRLAGLAQRRLLFARLVRPMMVVATRGRTW
jgi:hypothetical protein